MSVAFRFYKSSIGGSYPLEKKWIESGAVPNRGAFLITVTCPSRGFLWEFSLNYSQVFVPAHQSTALHKPRPGFKLADSCRIAIMFYCGTYYGHRILPADMQMCMHDTHRLSLRHSMYQHRIGSW